jgi:hypothetical protein
VKREAEQSSIEGTTWGSGCPQGEQRQEEQELGVGVKVVAFANGNLGESGCGCITAVTRRKEKVSYCGSLRKPCVADEGTREKLLRLGATPDCKRDAVSV